MSETKITRSSSDNCYSLKNRQFNLFKITKICSNLDKTCWQCFDSYITVTFSYLCIFSSNFNHRLNNIPQNEPIIIFLTKCNLPPKKFFNFSQLLEAGPNLNPFLLFPIDTKVYCNFLHALNKNHFIVLHFFFFFIFVNSTRQVDCHALPKRRKESEGGLQVKKRWSKSGGWCRLINFFTFFNRGKLCRCVPRALKEFGTVYVSGYISSVHARFHGV